MNKCSIPDCTGKARKRGWCGKHYERWRTHGDPLAYFPNKQTGLPCSIEGCYKPVVAMYLCQMHYARKFRHGNTDSLVPNYGACTITHKQGYIMRWVGDKYRMEHILLMEAHIGGPLPEGAIVHHKNGIVSDNRLENLEILSGQSEHMILHHHKRAEAKKSKE